MSLELLQVDAKILQPFFAAASEPDWYKPLAAIVGSTSPKDLTKVVEAATAAKAKLREGRSVLSDYGRIMDYYFNRIIQLARRHT